MSLRFPKGSDKNRHPTNIRHFGNERTLGERIADAVAAHVGSWPFIIIQSVLLLMWVVGNGFLIHGWPAPCWGRPRRQITALRRVALRTARSRR